MYRICHVITDKNIGGAGIWLLGYLNHYNKEQFEVSVILPEDSMLAERITDPSIKVHKLPMKESSVDLGAIGPIRTLLKEDRIQLLHTHASLSARLAGKLAGIPTIYTKHCLDEGTPSFQSRFIARMGAMLCDRVIAVSQATFDNLCAQGIPSSKIRIIPNGIRPLSEYSAEEKKAVRSKYGLLDSDQLIGILGRLEEIKGHRYLFEAAPKVFSKFPNAKIIVAGNGSLETELKSLCSSLGISDRVIFAGFVEDPASALNLFDINVCASLSESFSLSVGEAMSLGIVTIATRCGGPEELIADGTDGFLVPAKDSPALAKKIEYLLTHPSVKSEMSIRAKKKIREQYNLSIVTACLEQLYTEIIQTK